MLTKFAVKNFRGFSGRIEWDLSRPSHYNFSSYAVENGVVKDCIIYGPNGSGKTNLGLALFDITEHLSGVPNAPENYMKDYARTCEPGKPAEFEYTFLIDGRKIEYAYTREDEDEGFGRVSKECLRVDGEKLLYQDEEETYISPELEYSDRTLDWFWSNDDFSVVGYFTCVPDLPEDHIFTKFHEFVSRMVYLGSHDSLSKKSFFCGESMPDEMDSDNLDNYIVSHGLAEDFAEFLKEMTGQEFTFISPYLYKYLHCNANGVMIPLQSLVSSGTRNLELMYIWIKEIQNSEAPLIFIDDYGAFFNHDISFEICRRLFSLDAQVILTTHDTFLLSNEILRPDCYFVVKDNKIDALCNLTDKELRLEDNLERVYRNYMPGV